MSASSPASRPAFTPEPLGTRMPVGPDGDAALAPLRAVAAAVERRDVIEEIGALGDRLREARFHVACLGAFKRGKSTLLNALIGEDVLPTGIVPITAVPTVVRWGPALMVRLRLGDEDWREIGRQELATYVSEAQNPGNAKGVRAVELFVPSPLLVDGLSLVDTPGIGSIHEANTAATAAFVPQIDAALLVLGVDPPLTGEELALAARVMREAPHLLVVLNKADRFTDAEQTEASAFARHAFAERLSLPVGVAPPAVFVVSALGMRRGDARRFEWDALVSALGALTSERASLLAAARTRGVRRIAAALQGEIGERQAALDRPLAATQARVAALAALRADSARHGRELGARFTVEEQQLAETLAADRRRFEREQLPVAQARLGEELARLERAGLRGPALRRGVLAAASDIAEGVLRPWFAEQSVRAERLYQEVGAQFVSMTDGYLRRLLEAVDTSSQPESPHAPHPAVALPEDVLLTARSGFFFTHLMVLGAPVSVSAWLLDTLLPGHITCARILDAATRYLDRLVTTNASRVEGDVRDRIRESRRSLEGGLQRALAQLASSAARSLEQAQGAQREGEASVAEARARVATWARVVQEASGAPDAGLEPKDLPAEGTTSA